MSPKDFARQVQDNLINNDVIGARQVYHDWQIGNCTDPQNVLIYDAHTQTRRLIQCACGRCYHCYESKVNEWVTRMYAHLEDFKHVYFITLTYRSFVSIDSPASRLILDKLSQAVWHYDNYNFTHHLSYNPCLLVKSHYQNFFKRLRKNTGFDDITYVLCGEYGHDYGRPHFHALVFSNNEISRNDIVRAWSVCLWRNNEGKYEYCRAQRNGGSRVYFPIGRVDYNDLVTNGTLNTTAKIRIDGTYLNAAECFAYVCKYVCKKDVANFNRVKLAYHSMFHKVTFVKVYNNEIEWKYIHKYLSENGMVHYQIPVLINNLKQYVYEKIIYQVSDLVYQGNLQTQFLKSICGNSVYLDFFPQLYFDFRKTFSPFCEFSRGTPIGSVYAARHLLEFTQGVFNKPILQDRGFVVPTYFRRKADEYLYGFRLCRQTIKGISARLSGLVSLQGRLQSNLENNKPFMRFVPVASNDAVITSALRNCDYHFRQLRDGSRCISDGFFVRTYRFNRHTRKYECKNVVPIAEFLRDWLDSLSAELARHKQRLQIAENNTSMREHALSLLEECVADRFSLREQFEKQSDYERKHLQELYHDVHKSVE